MSREYKSPCVQAESTTRLHDWFESLVLTDSSFTTMNGGLFVSPGYGFHPTRVLDSHELIFVVQGSLDLFENLQSFHVNENEMLILEQGKRHGGIGPYTAKTRFYWLHFVDSDSRRSYAAMPTKQTHLTSFCVPKTATVSEPDRIVDLFNRFLSDQEFGLLTASLASNLLLLIFLEIARQTGCLVSDESGGSRVQNYGVHTQVIECGYGELVRSILEEIEGKYAEGLDVQKLAATLDYNPDYLERVFRRETGETLTHAINRTRIESACNLLRYQSSWNVNEIGFSCGYRSSAYFHRRFKEFVGLTPKQFRGLCPRTHINTH